MYYFINDISFQNCNKLMFADNIKIFRILVNDETEADLFQFDLNISTSYLATLNEWCINNNFTLNINNRLCILRTLVFFYPNLNKIWLLHYLHY